jgi:hypothetical protein
LSARGSRATGSGSAMGSAIGFAAARRGRRVVRRGNNFIVADEEMNSSVFVW